MLIGDPVAAVYGFKGNASFRKAVLIRLDGDIFALTAQYIFLCVILSYVVDINLTTDQGFHI